MRRLSPMALIAIAVLLTALLVAFVLAGNTSGSKAPPRDRLSDQQAGLTPKPEAPPPVEPWATLPGSEGETELAADYAGQGDERYQSPAPPAPPPPPAAPARARTSEAVSEPSERAAAARRTAPNAAEPRESAPRMATTDSPPARSVSARPSFNCRNARSRSEIAVCGDGALASLDRQMAGQFNRAVARGTTAQRQQLIRSRGTFLRRREACGSSSACIANSYRARMREIGEIGGNSSASGTPTRAPAAPAPATPRVAGAAPGGAISGASFNCRYALTNGEIAVCRNPTIASLDRQTAAQSNVLARQGTPAQRELLQRTRSRFLTYRDRCKSTACVAGAYRARIAELNDIALGRWKVP